VPGDALAGQAEPLGDHEVPMPTRQAARDLDRTRARTGQHSHRSECAAGVQCQGDVAAVRRHHDRGVPGVPGERSDHRH